MTMASMGSEISTGVEVYTSDNDKIGKVKEVRGEHFKIDAGGQPDYWLARSCVSGNGANGIRLSFDKDHLGESKIDEARVAAA